MRTGRNWRAALGGVVDLAVPLRCAGCGEPGSDWCPGCAPTIGGPRRVHRAAVAEQFPVHALGWYRGAARRAVLAYKESGRRRLAVPFADAIATGVRCLLREGQLPDAPLALVPAPSRPLAARRRGGAHLTRIVRRAATELDAVVADCLALSPRARDSVGLDAQQRGHNLRAALRCRENRLPPPNHRVLLLDDVTTTGATLAACARALRSRGVVVTAALVLTATGARR